jgi:hypothetical protein
VNEKKYIPPVALSERVSRKARAQLLICKPAVLEMYRHEKCQQCHKNLDITEMNKIIIEEGMPLCKQHTIEMKIALEELAPMLQQLTL